MITSYNTQCSSCSGRGDLHNPDLSARVTVQGYRGIPGPWLGPPLPSLAFLPSCLDASDQRFYELSLPFLSPYISWQLLTSPTLASTFAWQHCCLILLQELLEGCVLRKREKSAISFSLFLNKMCSLDMNTYSNVLSCKFIAKKTRCLYLLLFLYVVGVCVFAA